MRLLIAAGEWFPDRASGYARLVAETSRRLAWRGHDVTAIVPRFDGAPQVTTEGSLTVRRQLRRGRIPVTFTDVIGTWRRARSLGSSSFDLCVAHGPTNGFGLVAARLDAPLVLVYHPSPAREARFVRGSPPIRSRAPLDDGLRPAAGPLRTSDRCAGRPDPCPERVQPRSARRGPSTRGGEGPLCYREASTPTPSLRAIMERHERVWECRPIGACSSPCAVWSRGWGSRSFCRALRRLPDSITWPSSEKAPLAPRSETPHGRARARRSRPSRRPCLRAGPRRLVPRR